jgi:hypothetical protein
VPNFEVCSARSRTTPRKETCSSGDAPAETDYLCIAGKAIRFHADFTQPQNHITRSSDFWPHHGDYGRTLQLLPDVPGHEYRIYPE